MIRIKIWISLSLQVDDAETEENSDSPSEIIPTATADLTIPTSTTAVASPTSSVVVTAPETEESHFFRNIFFFVTLLAFAGAAVAFFGGFKKLRRFFANGRGYKRLAEDDVEK